PESLEHLLYVRAGRGIFRRLRQRRGIVGKRVQVGDDVGPFAPARYSGEAHLGARHVAARAEQELIEFINGPVATLGLHGSRIVEPGLRRARPADDPPQVWADTVRTALGEGMAGLTLFCCLLPLLDGGA